MTDGARAGDGATAPAPAVAPPQSERTLFWRRSLAGWDAAFYALLAISAISILTVADSYPPDAPTWAALGGLVVLLAAYLLVGRRGAQAGDLRLTRAYLVVLVVVVALCSGVSTIGSILLFVGFSQVWFFAASLREGVVASVVLATASCATIAAAAFAAGEDPSARDLVVLVAQMAVGLIFSLALGVWITRVAERSEERAELLERLEAAQAQLAVSNHAAGVLAERERVAQEIHDTLAQGFTSVVMLAQTAQAQLDAGRPELARDRLAQVEQVARDNLAEARALVAAFGPAALADATLAEALERLAERFQAETGVRVEVALGDAGAPDRDTEVVLLRAAQEALANVRKHAGARRVLLRLVRDDGTLALEVLDDGQGLAPGTAEGVGLRGMRERVTAGGGTLDVAGEPGRGTRVRLAMPLRDDARPGADPGTGAA
ncbi:sensor histidine kinase [Cellulomonas pakistanensis]|uniref:Oxygen sensor histidine kinase NreB n=1 Tax=Cellulomonas pakistanensis TaxID=992287 RepID=A0A919PB27_9CELL|nr:sensor histidine kinase [Cellulomonas pakistanensis]GIG35362.1 two-component sensor histidine kinase [Cellulomonas pakistanensis]